MRAEPNQHAASFRLMFRTLLVGQRSERVRRMSILDKLRTSLSDRYRIERQIGVGGMATVYLARDLRHDRPVALKLLSPELGAVLGPERFLSEIRVTAKLQHPNLLPLRRNRKAEEDSGAAGSR